LDLENWTHVQLWPILHGTTIISIDVHLFNVFNLIYRPRKHCDDTISAILKFADDTTTIQLISLQYRVKAIKSHIKTAQIIFTARCYAKRGTAMASRLSVRPSVRLSVGPSVRDVEVS